MKVVSTACRISILTAILFLLSIQMAWCAPGAIIISGVSEPFDRGDLDHMEAAFKNTRWLEQEKGGV